MMHIYHAREKYEKVTNAQCDLFHSAMVFKRNARFIRGSFWAIGDRKTVSSFFYGPTVVNGRRVPLDMTDSKRKIK